MFEETNGKFTRSHSKGTEKERCIYNGKISQITLKFNVSRTVREIMAPQLEYYFLNQDFLLLLLQVKESLSNHLRNRMKRKAGVGVGEIYWQGFHCPYMWMDIETRMIPSGFSLPSFSPAFVLCWLHSLELQISWWHSCWELQCYKVTVLVTQMKQSLLDFTFTFHFHALEKEMATHPSVLAWRIPGTGEPGGLPFMGSHRVGHDWSDLEAAAAAAAALVLQLYLFENILTILRSFHFLENLSMCVINFLD